MLTPEFHSNHCKCATMDRNAKCKVYPRDNSMEFVQQRQTDSLLPPRVNFLDWRLMATQHTSDFASR